MDENPEIKRILVIEDDPDYRKLLRIYLGKKFHQAELVEYDPFISGYPGPDFKWSEYDILILDYDLRCKQGTGLDILDANRDNPFFPVTIMLTGAGTEEVSVRAMKAGVSDYLRKKKLDLEDLSSAVSEAYTTRKSEQARQSSLEAARKVAKLQANKIFYDYKTKYKQLHMQVEARLEIKKRKLGEEIKKNENILKEIKEVRQQAELAKRNAALEVEKLTSLKKEINGSENSQEHSILKQKLKEARKRLEEMDRGFAKTKRVYEKAEDALVKTNWKLAKEELLKEQVEKDLAVFRQEVEMVDDITFVDTSKIQKQHQDT